MKTQPPIVRKRELNDSNVTKVVISKYYLYDRLTKGELNLLNGTHKDLQIVSINRKLNTKFLHEKVTLSIQDSIIYVKS